MPTVVIKITEAQQVRNNITFTAQQGDNVIERTIDVSEFDTWLKFAQWIINQPPDYALVPDKQKSLSITFHTETVNGSTVRVVDDAVVT